jgi:hypothetical protein
MTRVQIAKALALAFLAGPWTEAALVERGRLALGIGSRGRWLRALVRRTLVAFRAAPIDREDDLAAALRDDRALRWTVPRAHVPVRAHQWLIPEATMVPVAGPPSAFKLFPLPSHHELARCLDVRIDELEWFADLHHMNAVRAPSLALAHYHYRWVAKARGGWRLLEAPKARLKHMQRWLLHHVLAPIPAADAAHGFVAGRSVRTFVAPHVGRAVVVRLDLQDFFASVSRARVAALLRRVGYPRRIAATLSGLCTAPTPDQVLAAHPRERADLTQRFLANQRLRDPHLPQGAPTSPALSNLAAWRLDRRLAGLAAAFGATMTRYADDLAFSGDETFARSLRFFLPRAGAIALEEGFHINHRKTRVMHRGRRQHLCGVVINDRMNLPRRERDRLRAILHNVAAHGIDSQNRDGHPAFQQHLEGRIAWMTALNPDLRRRLPLNGN